MELQQQYIEQAINLHNNNPVVDAHLDLAAELVYRVRNGEMNPLRTYYLKNLRAAGVNLVVSSVYQSDRQLLEEGYEGALWQIHVLQEAIRADPEFMEVRTCKDLDMALATGRIGVLLYMEGLDCIGTDLDRLYQLWELGVRGASLTWSRENALAHGCCKAGERIQIPGGLTALGACAVREMEQMEMFLDVSHLNDDGFEDVDWIAQKPFLATHFNSRRVWFNYRNLRDDQMRRLAARGGMMGLNGCRCIVGCEGDQDPLEMLCRHVEYEAALISPEHVGYGFDFCDSLSAAQSGLEISAEQGDALKDHRQIILLTAALLQRGMPETYVQKIIGANFLEYFRKMLPR